MKKQIMKRAWTIYRELEGDRIAKLSMALRQAWAEAKNGTLMAAESTMTLPELKGSVKQVRWAEAIRKAVMDDMMAYFDSDEDKRTWLGRPTSANGFMILFFEAGVTDLKTSYYWHLLNDDKSLTRVQREDATYDYLGSISEEASTAYNALKEIDKKKAIAARAEVYKKYAKKHFEYSLGITVSASAWIDTYKGTKYGAYPD